MTNAYKSSSSNYKDLTIKLNQTYVYIKDVNVYINGEVRATLPFKNDQVTIKRETTVFIVITGIYLIFYLFFFIFNFGIFRSWFSSSI
jgi:hypothetical protein